MVYMHATRDRRREGVSTHGHTRGRVTRRGKRFPWVVEGEVSLLYDPGHEWWTASKSPEAKASCEDMTSGNRGGV